MIKLIPIEVMGRFVFLTVMLAAGAPFADGQVFLGQKGKIFFRSDAPLEIIEATSNELKGAINVEEKTFAFTVEMHTFQGFNSPLQQTHFNENYMESKHFPKATFTGKIIEDVDFSKDGEYTIRAKGKLNIHGVQQERIIKSAVKVEGGRVAIKSDFSVLIQEHNINIPKIVHQKIAEEISVLVEIELTKKAEN